ncbi:dihydroorotase [Patescibacteria group bacterium]|nr:dihydroorotase [Patescibacteria group bacterium]
MKEFALINGKIVTHEKVFDGTVFVKDGKIDCIKEGHDDAGDIEKVDVSGKHIFPGLIDVHVHFRTPGGTDKEDWTHGSKAALAGGVTTVLDMPNNDPPVVNQESLEAKRALVKDEALVNYGFYAGATGDNVGEIAEMKGIAGVKIYMGSSTAALAGSSTGGLLVDDLQTLEKFMTETDHLLVLHAENEACIREYMRQFDGQEDPAVHSKIRDPHCAYEAVKDALHMAKKYSRRTHLAHVSTAAELDTIRKFKEDYITAEVTPHHLFLTDADYAQYGNLIRVNPPVRNPADQVALWEAIKDGTIDMIATDHAPHLLAEKNRPYSQAPSGVPGVQTMLPLMLNAVNDGRITLEKVVELTSYNPAIKFGVLGKGLLEAGYDADITIVDMELKERICHKFLWSKCNWSPFHNWVLQGFPVMTYVAGNLMYEWRDSFGEEIGQEVDYG